MNTNPNKISVKLDIKAIEKYLINNGYEDIDLEQKWRHVTGRVCKNGFEHFFKLASTEDIRKKTNNEFEWNKVLNSVKFESQQIFFPKNFESGYFNNLFWFTGEFISGNILASPVHKNKTRELEQNLEIIAKTMADILKLETTAKLPNDTGSKNKDTPEVRFLKRLEEWRELVDHDIENLYQFIKKRTGFFFSAPSHGDFVPWHIIKSQTGRLYLIDGEHAKIKGFKFYDVAYFYHRVYTKLQRPDIADKFLNIFNKVYQFDKDDKECFLMILAQRVIGGYLDAQSDNSTSFDLQNELENKLLHNCVFT